jgi:signal transduction histidine kinase/ActR/RegA family two-component response regulator
VKLLRRFSEPPFFEDEELALRTRMFHRVMWNIMRVAAPLLVLVAVVDRLLATRAIVTATTILVLGMALLEVNRRGHPRVASALLIGWLVTMVTILSYNVGGIRSPGVTVYFIFVFTAGVLLGQRAALITTLVCASLGAGLIVLELAGFLPEPKIVYGPVSLWVLNSVYMTVVLGLLGLSNDALGGALRRAENELAERRVTEQRRVVLENQLRQSQKMEALGTLAGGIAHDFNNILMAILGNAELALADLDGRHPSRQSLVGIREASVRASDIVKRILVFSRRQEMERKIIALTPVLEEAIGLLRASLPKNIVVDIAFESDVPPIAGDASHLFQVVMNLATNASHAMEANGGVLLFTLNTVTVTAAEAASAVGLSTGPYVRFRVADNGTGMSRATLERVFEPFFTTKGLSGTGLGLSVVHGIIRDHHGAITVESELGKGTTFTVWIPTAASPAAADIQEAFATKPGRGERIMYVDDEEALLVVMERTLGRLGYKCTGFSDPVLAFQEFQCNSGEYAAVITDLAMPAMSGVELAQLMRGVRPDISIALASGHADGNTAAAAMGITTRIQKPFAASTLAEAINELLSPGVARGSVSGA